MVVLRQASVAVTVKSRDVTQPVAESLWVTSIVAALQVSLALEAVLTLASSGGVAGLQPRAKPVVGTVKLGPVRSTVQVKITCLMVVLMQASAMATVDPRDVTQQPAVAISLTASVAALEPPLSLAAALTLA